MYEAPRSKEQPRPEKRGKRQRSTGDSRTIPDQGHPPQRTQPSLGDPENAPGHPPERANVPRD